MFGWGIGLVGLMDCVAIISNRCAVLAHVAADPSLQMVWLPSSMPFSCVFDFLPRV